MDALEIFAGSKAIEQIKNQGFHPSLFRYFLGASGGPKWFTLAGLDRVIFPEWFQQSGHKVDVIGSSAGAFRAICAVQKDPLAAINRLAQAYSTTEYSRHPTPREITQKAEELVKYMVDTKGLLEVLENRRFKAHIIAARCEGKDKHRGKLSQMSGLAMSATANAIGRKHLGKFYTRCIFSSPNSSLTFSDPYQIPTERFKLGINNIHSSLLASGAIPIVLEGIEDIVAAPDGMYRDGGIIDYHFDLKFGQGDDLVLYPHFYNKAIPGWFDKGLKKRYPHKSSFDNVVMLVPSPDFVASLPFEKIPDRKDFEKMEAATRIRYWCRVLEETDRLGECFMNWAASGQIVDKIQPLPFNMK